MNSTCISTSARAAEVQKRLEKFGILPSVFFLLTLSRIRHLKHVTQLPLFICTFQGSVTLQSYASRTRFAEHSQQNRECSHRATFAWVFTLANFLRALTRYSWMYIFFNSTPMHFVPCLHRVTPMLYCIWWNFRSLIVINIGHTPCLKAHTRIRADNNPGARTRRSATDRHNSKIRTSLPSHDRLIWCEYILVNRQCLRREEKEIEHPTKKTSSLRWKTSTLCVQILLQT